jgi:hypothetical protein
MVDLMKPQAGELVQDPAAGTGGFLIAADRYIKRATTTTLHLSEQAAGVPAPRGLLRRRAGARPSASR